LTLKNIADTKMLVWTVENEYFTQIQEGVKTIEGRLPKFGVKELELGEKVQIQDYSGRQMIVLVKNKTWFREVKTYLDIYLEKALPGVKTVQEGIEIYRKYISEITERQHGIFAIEIEFLSLL
jgi:ASC-1-like (ASCH) protein